MTKLRNFAVLLILLLLASALIAENKGNIKKSTLRKNSSEENQEIAVSPPPFSEGIFPCSDCHADLKVNYKRRKLVDEHTNIVLKHDEKNRWCLDCHSPTKRDWLHLAGGRLVSFKESYKLCGQCHGPKLRDWKAGIHGKRTGYWNGKKSYLLCANCHNPHSPRFKPMKPLPPPVRQENIR